MLMQTAKGEPRIFGCSAVIPLEPSTTHVCRSDAMIDARARARARHCRLMLVLAADVLWFMFCPCCRGCSALAAAAALSLPLFALA